MSRVSLDTSPPPFTSTSLSPKKNEKKQQALPVSIDSADIPVLKKPLVCLQLQVQKSGMDVTHQQLLSGLEESNQGNARRHEFRKNSIEAQKKYEQQHQTTEGWGIFLKVTGAISSVVSIAFGIATLATGAGAVIGSFMIAAGVLNIANLVINECGGWNKLARYLADGDPEKQQKIQEQLNRWIGVGMLLFSLTTTVVGLSSAAVLGTTNAFEQMLLFSSSIAQGSIQMAQAIGQVGVSISEYQEKSAQIEAKEWDGKATFQRQLIEEEMERNQTLWEHLKDTLKFMYQHALPLPKELDEMFQKLRLTQS